MNIYLSNYTNLIKEGFWVFFGQISVAVISLVGLRIFTEISSADILGGATLLTGSITLLRNIFIAPIGNTQIRFHPEYTNKGYAKWFDDNIKILYIKSFFVSVTIFIIIFFIWSYFSSYNVNLLLLLILIFYYALDVSKSFKINRLSAERRQKFAAIWLVIDALLVNSFFIFTLLIVNNLESYLVGQSIGLFIGLIIFGIISYPKINDQKTQKPEFAEIKSKVVKYGLPFIPLAILSWISNLGDRYILGNYLTLHDVGIYTAVYSIASRPVLIFSGILSGILRPILFQAESKKEKEKTKIIFRNWNYLQLIFSFFIIFIYWVGGKFIINTLLSYHFSINTHSIFILVGVSYLIYSFIQTFENKFYSKSASKETILPSIIGSISNFLLNIILIPRFGLNGAALAGLISFSIHLCILILIYLKNKYE